MLLIRKIFLLFFILAVLQTTNLFSQTDTIVSPAKKLMLAEIKLRDGSVYKGHIEAQKDSLIYLRSSAGVLILIPKDKVVQIDFFNGHLADDTTGGKRILTHSIASYYYTTTSNAFLFNKGEIYGSNNYIFFGNVNYAFTRNFSLGVSTSIIGLPMGIHAKANFDLGHKLYFGLEGVVGSLMYYNPKTWGSGGTIKFTYGSELKNFTFYGGYFDAENWIKSVHKPARKGRPAVNKPGNYYVSFATPFAGIAFSSRLSGKVNFVADFFAFPSVFIYTGSFGIRGCSRQKISWTAGFQLINNKFPTVNTTYTMPYFGFSYRI